MTIVNKIRSKDKFSLDITIFILILLAGTFLRCYHLGQESFWLDEAYTASLIEQNPTVILNEAADDIYPPLYYLLLNGLSKVIPITEITLRIPSVIFSILSLVVIWKLCQTLFTKNTALLAAFFLAISPFHIQYAQEGRAYSLLLFSVLCSFTFLIQLKHKVNKRSFAGYLLSTTVAIYTHNFGVAFIAMQVGWLITEKIISKNFDFPWKTWAISIAIIGGLYLPWITKLIIQLSHIRSESFWLSFAIWQNLVSSYILFAGSIFGFIILIPLIIYFSISHIKEEKYRLLIFWAFVSPLAFWFIATFLFPVFTSRNIIPALPAFYILAALSLTQIRYKPVSLALIAIFSVSCLINLYPYYTVVQKDQWREAAAYLQENMHSSDKIYFEESFGQSGLSWYFDNASIHPTDTSDDDAWLVIYTNNEDRIEKLIDQRTVTQFKNIILAHPMEEDYPKARQQSLLE